MRVTENITNYIESITNYFKKEEIPYVIVGGLAVNAIGRARMTMDLDIIIDHTKLDRIDFVDSMIQEGFDITLTDLEGLDSNEHCTFYPKNSAFRIDLKGSYSELERESIEMSIDFTFDEVQVKIDNPINLILYKLKYGSDQDYEDALAVYAHNEEKIQEKVLKKRSKKIGVEKALENFLLEVKKYIKEEKHDLF